MHSQSLNVFRLFVARLFLLISVLALGACGGGGGTEDAAPTDDPAPNLDKTSGWTVFTNRSEVRQLALSADNGTLWLATNGGLEKRNAHTAQAQETAQLLKVYLNTDGLPSNDITAVVADIGNGAWVGTPAGLAHVGAGGVDAVYTSANSVLPYDYIEAISADTLGGAWIVSLKASDISFISFYSRERRLAHVDVAGHWQIYDLQDNKISALASDGTDGVWLGTYGTNVGGHPASPSFLNGSLVHVDAAGCSTVYTAANSPLPNAGVIEVAVDSQGGVWASSLDTYANPIKLAHLSAGGTWTVVDTNFDAPVSMVPDSQGGLWLGAYSSGIMHVSADGQLGSADTTNELSFELSLPYTFARDDQDGLWTCGQLYENAQVTLNYRNAGGQWTAYPLNEKGLPGIGVAGLAYNPATGVVSAAATRGGLAQFMNGEIWKTYSAADHKELVYLSSGIDQDNGGGLWIGVEMGVAHLSPGDIWSFQDTLGRSVDVLQNDGGSGVWLGTHFDGLLHQDRNGVQTALTPENSPLPTNTVSALEFAPDDALWVGSAAIGSAGELDSPVLSRLDANGQWTSYLPQNSSLPDSEITALATNNDGGVWIGTKKGLAHLSRENIWDVYTTTNSGLPGDEVTALYDAGADGLWLGTLSNDTDPVTGVKKGGGLAHLGLNGVWTVYTTTNSGLPDNTVTAVLVTETGDVWVGTPSSSGLARFVRP